MALRPFFLKANIDGRKDEITAGPKSKDGGMLVDVFMNKDKASVLVCRINCYVNSNGAKVVDVESYITY